MIIIMKQASRPDLVMKDKVKNECLIMDFAIPYDSRLETKEFEKLEKYQDQARELLEQPLRTFMKDSKTLELRQKLLNCRVQSSLILPGSSGKSLRCCHQASRTNYEPFKKCSINR